jgi:hypothetical protein
MSESVKQKKTTRTKKVKVKVEEPVVVEEAAPVSPSPVEETVKKARKPRTPKAAVEVAAEVTEATPPAKKKRAKKGGDASTEVTTETAESTDKKVVKRVFTVLSVKDTDGQDSEFKGGKFFSKTPAGAARKSANQACKILYNDQDCVVEVLIKEVTKNGSSKEYSYRAERKLAEKSVAFKGNSGAIQIPFKYSMILKSLKTVNGKTVGTAVPQSELDTVDESVA